MSLQIYPKSNNPGVSVTSSSNLSPEDTSTGRIYPEHKYPSSFSAVAPVGMDAGKGCDSNPQSPGCSVRTLELSNSGKQIGEGCRKQYVKQATGRYNETELHLAVKKGDLECVKEILCGSDDPQSLVSEENDMGETPLYAAAEQGHLEVLKELLKSVHRDTAVKKNESGLDAFHIAAKKGHLGIVKELLKYQPNLYITNDLAYCTPVISAATKGHAEVVFELLVTDGQLIDCCKTNGQNALHLAARAGYVGVVDVLLHMSPQMARTTDKKGQTPLHMAAKWANCLEVVQLLLNVDPALVVLPDRNGNTALHVATRKKRAQIVNELLLLPNINVNFLNRLHKTALDLAEELPCSVEASEIKEALVEANAVKAEDLRKPGGDELKRTVSAIRHDVSNQLKQTKRANKRELRKLHQEGINNATNNVTVVSVLFATVAFSAIFTVPGGFVGDNNNRPSPGTPTPPSEDNGTSVVANRLAFRIFIIFNAIALFTSIAVVVLQSHLQIWETKSQRKVSSFIYKLMWLASVCTSVAFLACTYIIVGRHDQWMAILVSAIGGVIMVGVIGTVTFCAGKFQRSRLLRKQRSSISCWSTSSHLDSEFSESEWDNRMYAI